MFGNRTSYNIFWLDVHLYKELHPFSPRNYAGIGFDWDDQARVAFIN